MTCFDRAWLAPSTPPGPVDVGAVGRPPGLVDPTVVTVGLATDVGVTCVVVVPVVDGVSAPVGDGDTVVDVVVIGVVQSSGPWPASAQPGFGHGWARVHSPACVVVDSEVVATVVVGVVQSSGPWPASVQPGLEHG